MKRLPILLACTALFAQAAAQASTPGQWDVGPQPIVYPVIASDNIYHDGACTVATCGVPDFFALQPTEIPSTVTDQITPGGSTTGTGEGKWRGTLFGDHAALDDPLRNHCDRGGSHLHEFLGSVDAGACSDYAQLRNAAIARHAAGQVASTNPGNDLNATPYWHFCLMDRDPLGDGVDRCKRVYAVPLYYNTGTASYVEAAKFIDFPLALGYVSGNNMDDPFMLELKAAITAANAANVAAGGGGSFYQYTGNGGAQWSCTQPDGTPRDGPYDNTEDLTCNAGDILIASMAGATCADGKNLYSPSGYRHVIPGIRAVALNGTFSDVCPVGWWRIPGLTNKPQWILHSAISGSVANDSPYASSDAMFQANARAQAGQPGAPADAASFICKAACSSHFDYGPIAWDRMYLRLIFRKCLGIPKTDPSEPDYGFDQTPYITECVDPTAATTAAGVTGQSFTIAHQDRFPDVNGDEIDEYYPTPVPEGHTGPDTMIHQ